jgi:hypothetical protein
MIHPPTPRMSSRYDLAAFLAVPVIAIILISAVHADPLIVQAVTDLVSTYLVWRFAAQRPSGSGSEAVAA